MAKTSYMARSTYTCIVISSHYDETILIWLWEDDGHVFELHNTSVNELLCDEYYSNPAGSCSFVVNSQHYKIDFIKMEQINLFSRRSRDVLMTQLTSDVEWLDDQEEY